MIEIKNRKTYKGDGFLVDRKTPLGNPFEINKKAKDQDAERKRVCTLYEMYFQDELEKIGMTEFKKYLNTLVYHYKKNRELILICWGNPKLCHAETIKKYIEGVCSE